MFDALPTPEPQPFGRRQLVHHGLHQRRLAHPRFARDPDDLAPALLRLGKAGVQLRHLGFAAHQRRCRRGAAGGGGAGGAHGDRGHKAIAQPMHGGDVARLLGVLPQRLAQGAQTGPQHPLAHHRLGPHGVEQGRFGHHLPGLGDQLPQHRQRLGRQRHHLRPHATAGPEAPPADRAQNAAPVVRHAPSPLGPRAAPRCHRNIRETSEKRQHFVKTSAPEAAHSYRIGWRGWQAPPAMPRRFVCHYHPTPRSRPTGPLWCRCGQGTALTPEALHGRVEHIVSGQATRFTSLEEFGAFLAQVLTRLADPQQAPEAASAPPP